MFIYAHLNTQSSVLRTPHGVFSVLLLMGMWVVSLFVLTNSSAVNLPSCLLRHSLWGTEPGAELLGWRAHVPSPLLEVFSKLLIGAFMRPQQEVTSSFLHTGISTSVLRCLHSTD